MLRFSRGVAVVRCGVIVRRKVRAVARRLYIVDGVVVKSREASTTGLIGR